MNDVHESVRALLANADLHGRMPQVMDGDGCAVVRFGARIARGPDGSWSAEEHGYRGEVLDAIGEAGYSVTEIEAGDNASYRVRVA